MGEASLKAFHQLRYGDRLVAGGFETGLQFELTHDRESTAREQTVSIIALPCPPDAVRRARTLANSLFIMSGRLRHSPTTSIHLFSSLPIS